MGAGKTTVGKELARRLACPFFDLDSEIETKNGRSIASIFAKDGENSFRSMERDTLDVILHSGPTFVLSLGGGTLQTSENRDLLDAQKVYSIYLEAPVDELWRRCSQSSKSENAKERPLLVLGDTAFRDRYSQREPNYRTASSTIVTMGKSIEQVITDCLATLRAI